MSLDNYIKKTEKTKRLMAGVAIVAAVILFFILLGLSADAVKSTPVITFDDVTVEYAPEGYMPSASIDAHELKNSIQYLAVNILDSQPVQLPLTQAGEYRVKAFVDATEEYNEAASTATIIILPVEITVAIDYTTVAYTSEPIPPTLKILPEWAADYFELDIKYTFFDEDTAASSQVEVPLRLGSYLVEIKAKEQSENFSFAGKAFIYKVAERRGRKLSSSASVQAVDPLIECEAVMVDAVYDGLPKEALFNCNPSFLKPEILYMRIDYTAAGNAFTPNGGSASVATAVPPVEPGEYEAVAVYCGVTLAKGTVVIRKIMPELSLSAYVYDYRPDGIYPIMAETNILCTFIAYALDEEGNYTIPASLPLRNIGKYLIVINPADTVHYESVYTLEYIDIVKSKATISSASQNFVYDGFEKSITYSVSPAWAECEVRYYTLYENGKIKNQLGTNPPINVGYYMATIYVKDTVNVELTTFSVQFRINPASESSKAEVSSDEFKFIGIVSPYFIVFALVLPAVLIIIFIAYIIKNKKK